MCARSRLQVASHHRVETQITTACTHDPLRPQPDTALVEFLLELKQMLGRSREREEQQRPGGHAVSIS
jgi:hypothetical protein